VKSPLLAVGNCHLRKKNQDQAIEQNYETAFELIDINVSKGNS